MQAVILELRQLVQEYGARFRAMDRDTFSLKPSPGRWSRKELLGHLVDSAQNNIRRFVTAQYELLPHVVYDQDRWVALQDYTHYPAGDLIDLWELLNRHLCIILAHMTPEAAERCCDTGRQGQQLHSLYFLAGDYLAHMKHHLEQVFPHLKSNS